MPERTLTTRDLNRALLARQLLLERSRLPLTRALERVAGLQAQYAPSAYIGLWSRLERFELGDLTRALERRTAVQGTLMRSTIHIVSARDYWPLAEGIRRARREWWSRTYRGTGVDMKKNAARVREALIEGPRRRDELVQLVGTSAGWNGVGAWIDLVRAPPSGTWARRRADLFAAAEDWLGPSTAGEDDGLDLLLHRYLGGFGPASLNDAASWAALPVRILKPVAERLRLRAFRDEEGTKLLDVPRGALPGGDARAPVRLLPTWDATLLVHARRTQILPERFRPRIFDTRTPHSFATFLVDGSVAGKWRVERTARKATLFFEPFESLPQRAERELRDEAGRLVRFVEPDVPSYAVKRA